MIEIEAKESPQVTIDGNNNINGNDTGINRAAIGAQILASQEITNLKANYVDRSDIRPTPKRYLILLLFCLHSAINAAQWIYLSSITGTVSKYYQVDNMAINWTSMIYMVVYIPLVVPSTWLFERIGMRNSIIIGSLGTSLGSLIKCFSCAPARFDLLMAGQTIVAISQLFVLSVPPRLASVWFPDHQVSLANACGVFGNQFGIALGFVVPQLIIGDTEQSLQATAAPAATMANTNVAQQHQQVHHFETTTTLNSATALDVSLGRLFWSIALVSLAVSLLIVFLFDHSPTRPPGLARLQQIKQEEAIAEAGALPLVIDNNNSSKTNSFLLLLWDLITEVNFALLMISYGLNVGVFYAISTVLNQMIAPNWTNANTLVGQLGLIMVVSGMFGSVVSGYLLDKTRMYRLVNGSLYSFSLIAMIMFALTLEKHHTAALYLAIIFLGYFMTGYLFIGYEMSNEITWPRPESVTAGLLNLSAQVFGVILTYTGSSIVDSMGNLAANSFFIVSILIGLIVTLLIKPQLRRQSAMTT